MRKELSKAFADLAIHKPLKLRPPSGPIASQDKNRSADSRGTVDANQSVATSRSKDSSHSRDEKQSQDRVVSPDSYGSGDTHGPLDAGASRVEVRSEDRNESQVLKQSRDKKLSTDAKESKDEATSLDRDVPEFIERGTGNPRRATIQDQAVTRTLSLKGALSGGYTRVPNELLMQMVEGELSRAEMKILLLVARLTISFERDMAPISKSVLERMTGVQGRKALAAVADLEKKGLLRKQQGDAMQPNELGLCAKVTLSKKQPPDASGPDPQDPKVSQGWDLNGPHNKERKEKREKTSLSALPENLQKYFAELKPEAKRESEVASLDQLKRDFSIEQIDLAFSHLQEQRRTGKLDCHSPMSFLKKAIGDFLPAATAAREKLELRRRIEADAQHEAEAKIEREKAEAKEFEGIEKAFREEFPTEVDRNSASERFAPANRYFTPGTRPFEMQVIRNWFESNKGGNL